MVIPSLCVHLAENIPFVQECALNNISHVQIFFPLKRGQVITMPSATQHLELNWLL